jgi:flagellar biosynthesis protein FliR
MAAGSEMIQALGLLQAQFLGPWLDAWMLILARVLGFITQAPITGRKDVIFEAKLGLGVFISFALVVGLPPNILANSGSAELGTYTLNLLLNGFIGAFLGFISQLVFEAVNAAGGFITAQIGLQAANIMDPTTKQQAAVFTPLFGLMGVLLFLDLGGFSWLLHGLERSFELFPLGTPTLNWESMIPFERILELSSNVMKMGVLLAAPYFVVTMLLDIMLGIVNRASQQIPVFQMSASLKPLFGLAIMWVTVRPMATVIQHLFLDYQKLF